jgi:hypothetical protein
VRIRKSAKGAEEISRQISALEDKISSMPAPTEPSSAAGMNIMRKLSPRTVWRGSKTAARGSHDATVQNKRSTIFGETARAASCTSGIALAASGVPLPNRRKATS